MSSNAVIRKRPRAEASNDPVSARTAEAVIAQVRVDPDMDVATMNQLTGKLSADEADTLHQHDKYHAWYYRMHPEKANEEADEAMETDDDRDPGDGQSDNGEDPTTGDEEDDEDVEPADELSGGAEETASTSTFTDHVAADDEDPDGELQFGSGGNAQPSYGDLNKLFARPTGDHFKISSSFVQWDAKLDGGKYVIMSEKELKTKCRHWQYWKPAKKHQDPQTQHPFIDAWLKDPQIDPRFSGNEATRCYWERSGVFPPPLKPPSNDTFNYWPGFAADRVELELDADTMKWLEFFLEHLDMLLNRDAKSFEFVLDWLAHAVQYPANKVGIMLCFLGDRRIGKTAVWNMMVKVFGEAASFETEEPDGQVWGKGNSPMLSAYVVRIKETTKQKMAANMGALRGCITDERMPIRPLYAGSFNINSYHRFFVDSNYYDAIPFTKGEGKAAVFTCSAEKKGNAAYFEKLFAKCINKPKVVRAFYELLKRREVKEMYQEGDIPQSDFSKKLQECNLSIGEKFAYHLIEQRYLGRRDQHGNEIPPIGLPAEKDCAEFYLTEPELIQAFKDWKADGGSLFDKANSSVVKELGLGNVEGVETMVRGPRGFFVGRQPRCSKWKNMEMRKRYGIGEDMQDPNDELRVGAAADAPAPIDCKQLLKTAFSELDFDWESLASLDAERLAEQEAEQRRLAEQAAEAEQRRITEQEAANEALARQRAEAAERMAVVPTPGFRVVIDGTDVP